MVKQDEAPAVEDLKIHHFIGRMKGIQGHQNSCYLDATLFAMFGLTNKFDEVICDTPSDVTAESILRTMCEEVIFPLRRYVLCRLCAIICSYIPKLRTLSMLFGLLSNQLLDYWSSLEHCTVNDESVICDLSSHVG